MKYYFQKNAKLLAASTKTSSKTMKTPEHTPRVVFGLEAQGHIPTIQAELKRWNEPIPCIKPYDMSYSKAVWEGIGKKIGWCPFTAALAYFEWLDYKRKLESESLLARAKENARFESGTDTVGFIYISQLEEMLKPPQKSQLMKKQKFSRKAVIEFYAKSYGDSISYTRKALKKRLWVESKEDRKDLFRRKKYRPDGFLYSRKWRRGV